MLSKRAKRQGIQSHKLCAGQSKTIPQLPKDGGRRWWQTGLGLGDTGVIGESTQGTEVFRLSSTLSVASSGFRWQSWAEESGLHAGTTSRDPAESLGGNFFGRYQRRLLTLTLGGVRHGERGKVWLWSRYLWDTLFHWDQPAARSQLRYA